MSGLNTPDEKKSFILLNAVIFHYHGLDEREESILRNISTKNDADSELKWSLDFISEDYLTAFDRARVFLNKVVSKMERPKRLNFINEAWKANYEKGYITEMEATAILQLAKDWEVDADLIDLIKEAS